MLGYFWLLAILVAVITLLVHHFDFEGINLIHKISNQIHLDLQELEVLQHTPCNSLYKLLDGLGVLMLHLICINGWHSDVQM